jgi:hypothetical protein
MKIEACFQSLAMSATANSRRSESFSIRGEALDMLESYDKLAWPAKDRN